MNSDSRVLLAIVGAVVLLLAWTFFLPVLQAHLRYGSVSYLDPNGECNAAQEAAFAWAGAGFSGKSAEWAERAREQCAVSSLRLARP